MSMTRLGRWILFGTALLIVSAWPPQRGSSLLLKAVQLVADPTGTLPFLPEQLGFGLSDDPQAVELHDELVRRYDVALASGPVMRTRLAMKVAGDPFDRATERQVLLLLGVIVAFLTLRRKAS